MCIYIFYLVRNLYTDKQTYYINYVFFNFGNYRYLALLFDSIYELKKKEVFS